MGLKNTKDTYGVVTKVFHWGIALTIYFMLALGYFMADFKPDSFKYSAYTVHKTIGIIVLFAVIARLIWRLSNTTPSLPATVPLWQRFAARFVHYGLYVALLTMPLSGWIMSTASGYVPKFMGWVLLPMPGIPKSEPLANFAYQTHEVMAIVFMTLIVIHILAALKHHLIDKDGVLKRMLPGSGKARSDAKQDNL